MGDLWQIPNKENSQAELRNAQPSKSDEAIPEWKRVTQNKDVSYADVQYDD